MASTKKKRKRSTTMADEMAQKLPNDIILEITTRLPLKYAARCSILNKYFHNTISIQKLLSSTNPIILGYTMGDRIAIISSPPRTKILPNKVWIIDSCNGIIFLQCKWSRKCYIFNPLTGGMMLVDYDIDGNQGVGLAVANPSSSSSSSRPFDFTVVGLHINHFSNPDRSRLRFSVYHVPSPRERKLVIKYLYFDFRGSFWPKHRRAVYAHGCLHWLGDRYTAIATFDIESQQARIMDGPLTDMAPWPDCFPWFGLARGSLHFICPDGDTITVHTHNYATKEWGVAHKIEIPNYLTSNRILADRRMVVEFFDGQSVFWKTSSRTRKNVEEIYVHDLSVGEWNRIGEIAECYRCGCTQFVPTTARVSNVYMPSFKKTGQRLWPTLRRLQRILLGG